MSRNFTRQPDESTLTTLCPHCLSAFRNARGIRVRRADPYFKKGRFDDEIDCA